MLVDQSEKQYFKKKQTLCYRGQLIELVRPQVMGILNLTPDSFFDGGKYVQTSKALAQVRRMIDEGADLIDIGAYSTRPGAAEVSEQEEIDRLDPVLKAVFEQFPNIVVSIDTFRSGVARWANQECGPCIINDVSGGQLDGDMFSVVANLNVPYILMHMRGTPQTMQGHANYTNVTKEVIKELSEKVAQLHRLGVCDVIIDPGFGFSKTLDQNYELFNHLDAFRFFELPVLVGISRKSMLYKYLGGSPGDSLNATTALNMLALQAGADILRVHDVKAAADAVKLFEKLKLFST
jgi:dihydropteroate synthase